VLRGLHSLAFGGLGAAALASAFSLFSYLQMDKAYEKVVFLCFPLYSVCNHKGWSKWSVFFGEKSRLFLV